MERKYTDRDVKTTFKRIKWPSIDKFWPFQEDNIFLIWSTTRFQNDNFQELSPIDNLKYLKSNAFTLQFNIWTTSFNQRCFDNSIKKHTFLHIKKQQQTYFL